MARLSNKEKPWKRQTKDDLTRHWLGEGLLGQESLFDELDPYIFLLDQAICSEVSRLAHQAQRRTFALLVPPDGEGSWLVPFLASRFELYIWADNQNMVLNAAAEEFDATMFSGEIPESITALEIVIFLDGGAPNEENFLQDVRDCCAQLSAEGTAAFVLRTVGQENELSISWPDGDKSSLSHLLQLLPSDMNKELITFPLSHLFLERDDKVGSFLKRHREYFGKNCRDLCLSRLREMETEFEASHWTDSSTTLLVLRPGQILTSASDKP